MSVKLVAQFYGSHVSNSTAIGRTYLFAYLQSLPIAAVYSSKIPLEIPLNNGNNNISLSFSVDFACFSFLFFSFLKWIISPMDEICNSVVTYFCFIYRWQCVQESGASKHSKLLLSHARHCYCGKRFVHSIKERSE